MQLLATFSWSHMVPSPLVLFLVSNLGFKAILGPDEDSEVSNFQITGKVGDFYRASMDLMGWDHAWEVLKSHMFSGWCWPVITFNYPWLPVPMKDKDTGPKKPSCDWLMTLVVNQFLASRRHAFAGYMMVYDKSLFGQTWKPREPQICVVSSRKSSRFEYKPIHPHF